MTTEELAEIKARCDAAMPGPWQWESRRSFTNCIMRGANGLVLVPGWIDLGAWETDTYIEAEEEDCQFIAAARTDIPKLITEIERLKTALYDIERIIIASARKSNRTSV